MDKTVKKPRLYIDVDGVLFGFYGEPEEFQLRPGVNSFLRWANEHFECWWLTAWGHRANELAQMTYFNAWFPVASWNNNKTEGINFGGEWFWIDDDAMEDEQRVLDERGCKGRFILVPPRGADALAVVRRQLELKFHEDSARAIEKIEEQRNRGY